MQKLWLKNFEFHINSSTWNTAQDLVRAGAVRKLMEIEKNFWVATVSEPDGEAYEVEAMISPTRVKAFTCECWTEGRRLICPHIAAGLFKVRQFLEQKSEARQARVEAKQPKESGGRLSVQNILNNATESDLAEFIRNYARQDRDFALALKTWFAGQVPGPENPFFLVLDAALPRHAGTRELKAPELRRLRKTLQDLEKQCANAALEANTLMVFQITTAILQKTTPLLVKLEGSKYESLIQFCQTAARQIIEVPSENLSPELRESRRDFMFELVSEEYLPTELEDLIIPFLGSSASDNPFFEKIRQLFDRKPFPAPQPILNLFVLSLAQRNLPEAVVRVFKDYASQPGPVKTAIAVLHHQQHWEAVLQAGIYFLENELFNAGQARTIESLMMDAAEKAGDKTRQKMLLRRIFLQNGSEEIYLRLKSVSDTEWPSEREKLLGQLQTAGNFENLAALLAADGDLATLTDLLKQHGNLTTLKKYESLLLPEHYNFVRDFYINTLSHHLDEHFGKQAAETVRMELAGLPKSGQADLMKDIIVTLLAKFPERQSLPEELAELFPKSRRQFV